MAGIRRWCFLILFIAMPVNAQNDAAQPDSNIDNEEVRPASDEQVIIVTGERERRAIKGLTDSITRRPRSGMPVARFFRPMCLKISGMPAEYIDMIRDRIEENSEELGAEVEEPGCKINSLVAFVNNSDDLVLRLREEEPWIFGELLDYEFDRILRGSEGARAWHTVMMRGSDGRDIPQETVRLPNGMIRRVPLIREYSVNRIQTPIRLDMTGSVVLIDLAHVEGKTFRQLADYATFRLLASTDDNSEIGDQTVPSILSLFLPDSAPPRGLTQFDKAYLEALYDLRYHARSGSLQNATLRNYRQRAESVTEDEISADGD